MVRILATSDLHYNVARSKEGVRELAEQSVRRGGDVLVIAGDVAGADPDEFAEALELFDAFRGVKVLVAGNHDLWVAAGQDSYVKWSRHLPELAQRYGFRMLDHGEIFVDGVAFVGNVGWYDYSFRLESLKVPLRFYEAKTGPGHAAAVPQLSFLVQGRDDLQDRHYEITTAWRDGRCVKLPVSDPQFTEELVGRLSGQLDRAGREAKTIVAVLHHLPRRDLVRYRGDVSWDFAAAFLGSQRFYDVLRQCPTLRLCLSGHSHRADRIQDNGATYVTIGSTYSEKVLLEFDV